jgi:putative transposase
MGVLADNPKAEAGRLCRAIGVSRSWFYDAQHPSAPDGDATELRSRIESIVLENCAYGYRRVTMELRRQGIVANHKRVLRVMREESLLCRLRKRLPPYQTNPHKDEVYENLVRGFTPTGTNQAWVADITYIRLPDQFCYLAAVLDLYSRRCIGWKLSLEIDARLAIAALDMALERRNPPTGLIHHSDRGVQYTCGAYGERLDEVGARRSMSAKGTPYDNAKAESFFKTLKQEEVYVSDYRDYHDALRSIEHFLEVVYNYRRLHSTLGYRPPVEFEQLTRTTE